MINDLLVHVIALTFCEISKLLPNTCPAWDLSSGFFPNKSLRKRRPWRKMCGSERRGGYMRGTVYSAAASVTAALLGTPSIQQIVELVTMSSQ